MKYLYFILSIRFLTFFDTKKNKRKLLPLTKLSIVLMAVCLFLPILILSITHGFQNFTIDSMKNFYSSYWIKTPNTQIKNIPQKLQKTSYFEDFVVLRYHNREIPSLVRATNIIDTQLVKSGSLKLNNSEIWISETIAMEMGINIGDTIDISTFNPNNLKVSKSSTLKVRAIISYNNAALDRSISLINTSSIPAVFGLKTTTVNTIYSNTKKDLTFTKTKPIYSFDEISSIQQMKNQYLLLLILSIITTIFCLYSTYISSKTNFQYHIHSLSILRVLGLHIVSILYIFALQSIITMIIGLFLGCILCFTIIPNITEIISFIELMVNNIIILLQKFIPNITTISFLPKDRFYINTVPVQMQSIDFIWIITTISIGTFIVSYMVVKSIRHKIIIEILKKN